MAIDEKGKRFDNRPKDPAVPPHIRNSAGLNSAQKKMFAAYDRKTPASKRGATGRKNAKRTVTPATESAPATVETAPTKTPAKNGRRRKPVTPTTET